MYFTVYNSLTLKDTHESEEEENHVSAGVIVGEVSYSLGSSIRVIRVN